MHIQPTGTVHQSLLLINGGFGRVNHLVSLRPLVPRLYYNLSFYTIGLLVYHTVTDNPRRWGVS